MDNYYWKWNSILRRFRLLFIYFHLLPAYCLSFYFSLPISFAHSLSFSYLHINKFDGLWAIHSGFQFSSNSFWEINILLFFSVDFIQFVWSVEITLNSNHYQNKLFFLHWATSRNIKLNEKNRIHIFRIYLLFLWLLLLLLLFEFYLSTFVTGWSSRFN